MLLSARQTVPHPVELPTEVVATAEHVAVYGVLTALLHCGLPAAWSARHRRAVAFGVALAYAVTDEVHQAFVPRRDPSPLGLTVASVGGWLCSPDCG